MGDRRHGRIINFSPGPAKLPEKVLQRAQKESFNYRGMGISIKEMSHRSSEFSEIIHHTDSSLRRLLDIPDNYRILFLQGGGSAQFSAVPLNLMSHSRKADYIITGSWSAKAAKEAEKYGHVNRVITPTPSAPAATGKHTDIPLMSEWSLTPDADYVYYCANETVHGVEFHYIPETGHVPLVCDMSSNILTRPFDVSKFGLIYAGAQKNIGCSGCTLVIVREDLIGHARRECPSVFDYMEQVKMNSMFNTPPTYSIYIMSLVFDWLSELGGLAYIQERNNNKSNALYEVIDTYPHFYWSPVSKSCRSRMNVPFRIGSSGAGDDDLERTFINEAGAKGMIQIKGHRSVGGIRVSLYNAINEEETQTLVDFMHDFYHRNSSATATAHHQQPAITT